MSPLSPKQETRQELAARIAEVVEDIAASVVGATLQAGVGNDDKRQKYVEYIEKGKKELSDAIIDLQNS